MTAPGPAVLGRGVVVAAGADPPPGWEGVPRVQVDESTLSAPDAAACALHRFWSSRRPVVVELAVDAGELREPQRDDRPPFALDAGFDFALERLHFLVWANNYDTRRGSPVWWHGVRATRLGASEGGPADILLEGGRPAWCDGGPRQPLDLPDPVVHRDSIDAGALRPARFRPSAAVLAPDQRAAVEHPGGPARIIAPAGSGKTRVLTERLRHLIGDRNHEPGLVTAVAYNVKAAEEMRERTEELAPNIRTLNSLGLRICELAGPVRVIEETEVRRIIESLVHIRRRTNTDPVAPYLDALSAIRLGLADPDAVEARFPDATGVAATFPTYREALARLGAVDFDEQIYRAVELCLRDPGIRSTARATARTLLVDEFQDLTPAHVLLIRLLAGPAASVFGVGDDDQVIYGYTGADPRFLIDFDRYFPGAASYALTVNYRCPVGIVKAATTLLTHNRRRLPKDVTAGPGREPAAGELTVERVDGPNLAPAVVERVRGWIDADSRAPSEVAVLARVNSVLLPVQVALLQAGIPSTQPVGAELLFRTGMAATLAYLRMAMEPDRISRADVQATIRRPSRRIAPNVVDMIVKRPFTSVDDLRRLSEWLSGDDSERVAGYAADIEAVAKAAASGTTARVLAVIGRQVGLHGALATLDASKGGERSTHGDDFWALQQVAALHPDPSTFEAWLRQAVAARPPASGSGSQGVQLSTVHRVKGREWPLVIVFGVAAGLFPHRLAEEHEEERRVFHVAITRGRERVVVLADAESPSPFVAQLDHPATAVAGDEPEPPARSVTSVATRPPIQGGAGWEALRTWRAERARRDQVPAYIVLSDAHLRAIVERSPTSLVELSRCPGIGPVKLDRYGDEILSVLAALPASR